MVRAMHWATPEERRKLGQARRKQVGRQHHDELNIKARQSPALALLERFEARARSRPVEAQIPAHGAVALRLLSRRGAGHGGRSGRAALTGIVSQLCGDAHVRNLGAFAAPDGRLVFDINDFDETIRGPFEWDLKRMAASLVLAGRESGHKESSARAAVEACIGRYCAADARLRRNARTRGGALSSASPRFSAADPRCAAEGRASHAPAHAGAAH